MGRSSKADLVLSDRFLSRQHARFYREGEAWMVEDLGSRNTTLLNGRPLAVPGRVSAGDLVKLSETVITIDGFDDHGVPPQEPRTASGRARPTRSSCARPRS